MKPASREVEHVPQAVSGVHQLLGINELIEKHKAPWPYFLQKIRKKRSEAQQVNVLVTPSTNNSSRTLPREHTITSSVLKVIHPESLVNESYNSTTGIGPQAV